MEHLRICTLMLRSATDDKTERIGAAVIGADQGLD